eukprot:COSAG02_NODE_8282_length_2632_cov_51.776272_4_plen_128_part_00
MTTYRMTAYRMIAYRMTAPSLYLSSSAASSVLPRPVSSWKMAESPSKRRGMFRILLFGEQYCKIVPVLEDLRIVDINEYEIVGDRRCVYKQPVIAIEHFLFDSGRIPAAIRGTSSHIWPKQLHMQTL